MPTCNSILVIEDDVDIRDALQQVLELEGYAVSTAGNGREGIESLEAMAEMPCVILLDLMMPVMNGWEFLAAQRASPPLAGIPVVVVTAAGDKAKTVDTAAYLKKPVDLNALLDVVKRYCPAQ